MDELIERVEKVEHERDRYRQLYLDTLERCRMLERGLIGQKAERLAPNEAQLALQVLGQLLEARDVEPEPDRAENETKPQENPAGERRPRGRQVLPANLPRVEIELIPDEVQREGLDAFERIGEQVSEVLERRPASLVVVCMIRPKFVRKDRERNAETEVITAPPAELPIPRGLAGPGLLADSIVRRWADHLPANRLEKIYGRDGVHLARSTICSWHEQLAELVQPLIDAMWPTRWRRRICVRTRLVCWSRRASSAREATFGSWSRPSDTCCFDSRRSTTKTRSRRSSARTRAIWSPTRTRSTTTSTRPATSWRSGAGRTRGGTSSRRCRPSPTNATFVTLIASCQLHGIEPWVYLRDLLSILPQWPRNRVLELAPVHWRETLEQEKAQEILRGDVCRVAMIAFEEHSRPV